MSEPRTVTLHFDHDWRNKAMAETNHDEWYRALGRLASWGRDHSVDIYPDGHDMTAVYKHNDGETRFVIGAIWHGDHYGFHS